MDEQGERGRRAAGHGVVVVRPRSRRRYQLGESVFDSTGSRWPRFERCSALEDVNKQFLLKRVAQEGRETRCSEQDVEAMAQLRDCPHILTYLDAWVTPGSPDVLHVLCRDARMFLSVFLRTLGGPMPFSPQLLFPRWLFQLASALQYLHGNNPDQPILHRDLQPDNIMVTDTCNLKLCAFGTSKRLDRGHSSTSTVVGAGLFKSPEIAKGNNYKQSADIWSLGVTAVHIASYSRAKEAGSAEQLLEMMATSGQTTQSQAVVRKTLREDPARRPEASAIVSFLEKHHSDSVLRAPVPPSSCPWPLVISATNDNNNRRTPPKIHRDNNGDCAAHKDEQLESADCGGTPHTNMPTDSQRHKHGSFSRPVLPPPRQRTDNDAGIERRTGREEQDEEDEDEDARRDREERLASTADRQKHSRVPGRTTLIVVKISRHPHHHRDNNLTNNDRHHHHDNKNNNLTTDDRHHHRDQNHANHHDGHHHRGRGAPSQPAAGTFADCVRGHHGRIDQLDMAMTYSRVLRSSASSENCTEANETFSSAPTTMASSMTTSSNTATLERYDGRRTMARNRGTTGNDQHRMTSSSRYHDDDCQPMPQGGHPHPHHHNKHDQHHANHRRSAMNDEALRTIAKRINIRERQQQQPDLRTQRPSDEGSSDVDERLPRPSERRSVQSSPLPLDRGPGAGRQYRDGSRSQRYHSDTDNTSGLGDSVN